MRRNYATPVAERPGLKNHYEEQFYNKKRVKEVKRNSLGQEIIESIDERRQNNFQRLRSHAANQTVKNNIQKLGHPFVK